MNPSHLKAAHKRLIVSYDTTLKIHQSQVTCPITGITFTISEPAIPGYTFNHLHPIASFEEASKVIIHSTSLKNLDQQVLAGLVISIYKHWSLLDTKRLSGLEANLILRSAGPILLLECLNLSKSFSSIILRFAPSYSLDWQTHQDSQSIAESLQTYLTILRNIVYPTIHTKAEINTIPKKLDAILNKKVTDFETQFKAIKKEANQIISDTLLPPKLQAVLRQVFAKRNLLLINDEQRNLLAGKCRAIGLTKLATFITETFDPMADVFDSPESALERASDSFSQVPKKSLAEILAAKKASK